MTTSTMSPLGSRTKWTETSRDKCRLHSQGIGDFSHVAFLSLHVCIGWRRGAKRQDGDMFNRDIRQYSIG